MKTSTRIVRAAVTLGGAGLASIVPGLVAPAAAAVQNNWAEARVVLPTSASQVEINFSGTGSAVAGSPDATGFGASWPGGHFVDLFRPNTTSGISASGYAGSVTVLPESTTPGGAGFGAAFGFHGPFQPGAVLTLLFFDPSNSLAQTTAAASADGTAVPVDIIEGSGAATVSISSPTTQGTAVATPVASAGFVTSTTAVPSAGIVGAASSDCLSGYCYTDWAAPDGRTGSYPTAGVNALFTGIDVGGPNPPSFAGPAGSWSWRYVGASGADVIAALAPIGADWTLYQ